MHPDGRIVKCSDAVRRNNQVLLNRINTGRRVSASFIFTRGRVRSRNCLFCYQPWKDCYQSLTPVLEKRQQILRYKAKNRGNPTTARAKLKIEA